MKLTLPGRVAVVTGASSGLGELYARRLAALGWRVILVARRANRLQALTASLGNAEAMLADLADPGDLERVAARLRAEPSLALLVNNAGFGTKGLFSETAMDRQVEMHRVHVDATMQLTRAALEGMVARKEGAIVNVASVAGFFRSAGNASYCATKAWMNAFSESLWLEMRQRRTGVTIQALCPGFTYTEFHDTMGVSRDLVPKWLWMPAGKVIDDSLRGLETGKLYVVPGWPYKLAVAVLTRLPVGLRLALQAASPHKR